MRKIQPNPLIGGETENAYVSSAIQERTNRGTVFQNIVPLFSVLAQKKKQTIPSIRKVENIVSLLTEIRYFYLIFLVFRWYER